MKQSANYLIENRQIRVFISSTFRDMQVERDYLMTKVFPRLRKKAARRDVSLIELDLRWGITEDESQSGRVVQICLNEIDNSRPFFIGLLGDRYGWCPDRRELGGDALLEERYPWLMEDLRRGVSMTEIEMQYGVLRSDKDINAFFFLKKNGDESDERLHRLKETIRNNRRYPCAEYEDAEHLGRQVEAAFDELLDRLFPQGRLMPLEAERLAQRAFLRGRCGTYVRNEKDFGVLNAWLTGDQRHLVVTGPSGMGKSALIANWIDDIGQDTTRRVIYHFVGYAGGEGDYRRILNRLNDEIRDLYALDEDPRAHNRLDPERSFPDLLMQAGSRKPLLIVLDGIDQLSDEHEAKLLNWLPKAPEGVKMLFSTQEDDATAAVFRRREYPEHTIRPLDESQRRKLVVDYLQRYGKALIPARIDRIVEAPVTNNTLVLRTLLDELVSFGIHEQLDRRIDRYLDASGPEDFFRRVLQRAEEDYGEQLVRDTLSLIAVSRAGMSESELLGITRSRQLEWSQFYCAFAGHFTVKNGLLQFTHRFLREAVRSKYLSREADTDTCRERIIAYMTGGFTRREDRRGQGRIYDELAHQYHQAGMSEMMYDLLADYDAFNHFYESDRGALGRYWRHLLETGRYSLDVYLHIELPEQDALQARFYYAIDDLLGGELIEYKGGCPGFIRKAVEIGRRAAAHNPAYEAELVDSLVELGNVSRHEGDADSAKAIFGEALGVARRLAARDAFRLYVVLDNFGWMHEEFEEFEQAERMYREAIQTACERMAESDKWLYAAGASRGNLAVVYRKTGRPDLAEQLTREALSALNAVVKQGPRHQSARAVCLHNLASLHWEEMGRFEEAEREYDEALKIRRRMAAANPAGRYDLIETLNASGLMYREMGRSNLAQKRYEEALTIERELAEIDSDPGAMIDILFQLGLIHTMEQQYDEAIRRYTEALSLIRNEDGGFSCDGDIDLLTTIVAILQNLASIHYNRQEFGLAVTCCSEALDLLRDLLRDGVSIPDREEMITTLLNYTTAYRIAWAGEYFEARDYLRAGEEYVAALELCDELENEYGRFDDLGRFKLTALNRLGIILCDVEEYDEAEKMFLAAFDLAMELFRSDEETYYDILKSVCDNLVVLYTQTGRPELAEGFNM